MNTGLRALLAGVIDYAGLFPPAKLPLDQAIRNYAEYRRGPDAWMLGRFVVPAGRLAEAAPLFAEAFASGPPAELTALLAGADDPDEFVRRVDTDLQAVADFEARPRVRAVVGTLEVRLPPSLQAAAGRWANLLSPTGKSRLERVSFEAPSGEQGARAMIESLRAGERGGWAGVKLRCGGLEASAFPPAEQVAFVLNACRAAALPLKFTAGLHHPFRRFDAGVGAAMHGFVNVFVAGVLAHARRLPSEALQRVLEDENPSHFSFSDAGLRWGDSSATAEEVTAARRDFVTSFGSCSFDEPRDDLRALGWL
jgi:hypothetical protein